MFVGTTKGRHKWIIKKWQWNRNEMFTQPSLEISTSSVDTFLIRKSIDSLPKRFKWLSVHIGLNCATFYCFSSSRNSYLLIFFFGSIFEERYKVNSNIDLPRGFCIAERSLCKPLGKGHYWLAKVFVKNRHRISKSREKWSINDSRQAKST